MNAARQSQIFGFASFLFLTASFLEMKAAQETIVTADRARAGVMMNDVTVDGQPRPDIGQSFSDSLTAALLKSGDYRVFQLESGSRGMKNGKQKKSDPMLGSTAMTGGDEGVDITFAFSLVGHQDLYRLTLKKIRTSDKEVLEVHELSAKGSMDRVYGMVPQVLMRLQATKKQIPAFPRTQSPAQLAAPVYRAPQPAAVASSSSHTSGNAAYWSSAVTARPTQPSYDQIDFTKVPKALIYQPIGSVQVINETWKFCIIRPREALSLRMNDSIHVLYEEDGKVYADMKIANFDSGRVIADFGNKTPPHHKLFPGDEVFGWAPPIQ